LSLSILIASVTAAAYYASVARLPASPSAFSPSVVEFELASVPHLLSTTDYKYRECHGEAISRFRACAREGGGEHAPSGLLPPTNLVLSSHADAIGIRLRDTRAAVFPRSRKILAEVLAGVPGDEQAKHTPDRERGSPAATPPRVPFRRG
jgi:hypothetical protein